MDYMEVGTLVKLSPGMPRRLEVVLLELIGTAL